MGDLRLCKAHSKCDGISVGIAGEAVKLLLWKEANSMMLLRHPVINTKYPISTCSHVQSMPQAYGKESSHDMDCTTCDILRSSNPSGDFVPRANIHPRTPGASFVDHISSLIVISNPLINRLETLPAFPPEHSGRRR